MICMPARTSPVMRPSSSGEYDTRKNPLPPAFTMTAAAGSASGMRSSSPVSSTFVSVAPLRTCTGTFHSVASGSLSKVKRHWESTRSPPSRRADTRGKPGCQMKLSISARTGTISPPSDVTVSSMASHRSPVSVFP